MPCSSARPDQWEGSLDRRDQGQRAARADAREELHASAPMYLPSCAGCGWGMAALFRYELPAELTAMKKKRRTDFQRPLMRMRVALFARICRNPRRRV